MPVLRSGSNTSAALSNNRPNTMANNNELFRQQYDKAVADVHSLFPSDEESAVRDDFLKVKRTQLLTKYGFLESTQPAQANSSTPTSEVEKRALLVKNFVATCNKYDDKRGIHE